MPTVVIHPGETIVVTGVNGLLGSHVADQLLERGYNVRGVVRSIEKSAWLQDYFDDKHKQAKFELVAVPDMSTDECYDAIAKGAAGFVHMASPLTGESAETTIPPVIQGGINALKACMKTPTLKSFVLTSSSVAATFPKPNVEFLIDESSYNDEASILAREEFPGSEMRRKGWYIYGALKTETEKAMWQFVKENEPSFVFNTVLPNANFGEVLVPEHQGWPSTVFWLRSAFTGELFDLLSKGVEPQYYVSIRDTALIHISALIHSDVSSERLFAYSEPFTWNKVLAILRKLYPGKTFPKNVEDEREDKSKVANQRAEEVLRWLKGNGTAFDGLEVGVKECANTWV